MNEQDFHTLLKLLKTHDEISWIEAKDSLGDLEKIAETISALANTASYQSEKYGYIIWWLANKTWDIIGTKFDVRKKTIGNNLSEIWLHDKLNKWGHWDIFEFNFWEKKVIVMRIKNCGNSPVFCDKIAYIRKNSVNKNLSEFPEIARVIYWNIANMDWSAEIVSWAGISDLDSRAIRKAREQFREKNKDKPEVIEGIESWSDEQFLDTAKITRQGKITRAALILLGREETAADFLNPAVAQITWELWSEKWEKTAIYEHFYPPYILTIDRLAGKIRNELIRYLPDGTLFENAELAYDPWSLREWIHNAVAHMDYTKNARIHIDEYADRIILQNPGKFLHTNDPVRYYFLEKHKSDSYRNKWLVDAMVNLNMINTLWLWLWRMFDTQIKRKFPLHEYKNNDTHVRFVMYGKILDPSFIHILERNPHLAFDEVIVLDRIQKWDISTLDKSSIDALRKKWFLEGRYPHLYLSSEVSATIAKKEDYIKKKWFDDRYYLDIIISYIQKYWSITKDEVRRLIVEKLPDILSKKQKEDKVWNLLIKMKSKGFICKKDDSVANKEVQWILRKPD